MRVKFLRIKQLSALMTATSSLLFSTLSSKYWREMFPSGNSARSVRRAGKYPHSAYENFGCSNRNFWSNGTRPIWSQTIADRRSQRVLRSSAIIWEHTRPARLRSCGHMEAKVLRSANEMYPIILWIPTRDITLLQLLSNKARIFVCSNHLFDWCWTKGNVSNEEFMYEWVYHRNSKDKNKYANCWEN